MTLKQVDDRGIVLPADAETAEEQTDAEMELQLPIPKGYRILVALPEVEKTFAGSQIERSDADVKREYILSIMGVVIDMGEDAYTDKERYPTGPWCKRGDYVLFRMNTGTRISVGGREFRIMNDDSVEAVIPDPSGVMRAF